MDLGYGAVAEALRRLRSAKDAGAVCGKIVRTHGRLQEAGSIIWSDGTTTGYLRDGSPLTPAANFVRDVDYGSAVFLLCRAELVKSLCGFDEDFMPAYYEDADLCVRMIGAGYRIIYDPAVSLEHLEFGSAATSGSLDGADAAGEADFPQQASGVFARAAEDRGANLLQARSRGGAKRVLFVEDTVPLRRLGSGFVRSNDIVHAIDAAGHEVHVFPINGAPYSDEPAGRSAGAGGGAL